MFINLHIIMSVSDVEKKINTKVDNKVQMSNQAIKVDFSKDRDAFEFLLCISL